MRSSDVGRRATVPAGRLKTSVRLLDLVTLGAGTAIGASIFSILGPSAKVAGSGLLISVLISALPMCVFGFIYAFLSSAYPRSGASYEWQRTFVHPLLGFVVVWLRVMGTALTMSVMGRVLLNYLGEIVHLPGGGKAIIFGFFTAVFILNYVGVGVAARAQTVIMALLLMALLIFVATAAPHIALERIGDPIHAGPVAILSALPLLIHLYMGIETCTEVGEEVEDAKRIIPLALAIALALCGLVYLLVAAAALGLAGPAALAASHAPLLTAAQVSLGRFAVPVIGFAAVLALAKSMNAVFLVFSRFLFAMGRSGVLPTSLAAIHPRFGTPTRAILTAYGASVVCLLLPNDLIFLFLATTIPNMLKYFSTCLSALRVVQTRPDVYDQARLKAPKPVIAAAALAGMAFAAIIAAIGLGVDTKPYVVIGAWLLVGLLYWAMRFRRLTPAAS